MTDTTEEEPSIEEILESIRQIISDDDEEGDAEDGGELKTEEEPAADGGDLESEEEEPAADGGDLKSEKEDDYTPADIDGDLDEDDSIDKPVLELSDVVEDADGGDLKSNEEEGDGGIDSDVYVPNEEDDFEPADIVMEEVAVDGVGKIMSEDTEDSATDSFGKLAANVFVEEVAHAEMIMPAGRITLEQITRELMRPLLKEWLDSRLPDLVEDLVQKEIKKLSDRAKK